MSDVATTHQGDGDSGRPPAGGRRESDGDPVGGDPAAGAGRRRQREAGGPARDTESTIIYLQQKHEKQTTVNVTPAALDDPRALRKRLARRELRVRARPDYGLGR
jgi:hypothetical protein